VGKQRRTRAERRSVQARTPEAAAERQRQLLEADRVVQLAWRAGLFDDLDQKPGGRVDEATVGWEVLRHRVQNAAYELLQGQYPEVEVRVGVRGWRRDEWSCTEEDTHPWCRIKVELRQWLRDGRLRQVRTSK
jgi:hypothetical protein